MIIKSIELVNYRNYEKAYIDLDSGINILYGDNAQGKTNILESVYMCATTKSHRGSKDKEIIKFGTGECFIGSALIMKYDGKGLGFLSGDEFDEASKEFESRLITIVADGQEFSAYELL